MTPSLMVQSWSIGVQNKKDVKGIKQGRNVDFPYQDKCCGKGEGRKDH
jgi:hypothetical protein